MPARGTISTPSHSARAPHATPRARSPRVQQAARRRRRVCARACDRAAPQRTKRARIQTVRDGWGCSRLRRSARARSVRRSARTLPSRPSGAFSCAAMLPYAQGPQNMVWKPVVASKWVRGHAQTRGGTNTATARAWRSDVASSAAHARPRAPAAVAAHYARAGGRARARAGCAAVALGLQHARAGAGCATHSGWCRPAPP